MIKAVLFDQDGVIIDTERDGHRIAFEKAFLECGYAIKWDIELYHKLLQVGGGKERIKHYFENYYEGKKPQNEAQFIKDMHEKKTAAFLEILETLPLRPGIRRFMREIKMAGILTGICTTSNEKIAHTIASNRLQEINFNIIIAGDSVAKKKPDPEIYLTALEKLGVKPSECLVVEDSNIGVIAAKAAGCRVIATFNDYTKEEDLNHADIIVSCLGDEDGEKASFVKNPIPLMNQGIISLADLIKVF